jgi:hypothetical protein
MKTNLIRFGVVALLGVMLFAFTQCFAPQTVEPPQTYTTNEVNIPTSDPLQQDLNAPDVGVKDFERTYFTFMTLTGITNPSNNLRTRYNTFYRMQLPTSPRLEAYNQSHMLATTKLATDFCNELLNNSQQRAVIWPGVNFGTANLFQNVAARSGFIDQMTARFWGMGVMDEVEYADAKETLDTLIQEAVASNTTTLNTAKLACSAALASGYVVID